MVKQKPKKDPSVAERAKLVIKQTEPYLQSDGQFARFERLEKDELYISIHSETTISVAEKKMIKLGIEKKIFEEIREIKKVILI